MISRRKYSVLIFVLLILYKFFSKRARSRISAYILYITAVFITAFCLEQLPERKTTSSQIFSSMCSNVMINVSVFSKSQTTALLLCGLFDRAEKLRDGRRNFLQVSEQLFELSFKPLSSLLKRIDRLERNGTKHDHKFIPRSVPIQEGVVQMKTMETQKN